MTDLWTKLQEAARFGRSFLSNGGFFNPDMMASVEPDKTRTMVLNLIEAAEDALAALRTERGEEPLTFQVFSQMNRERCESPNGFNHALGSWDTSDWFLAVLGELGEAANVAKKLNRVRDGIPGNKETPDELRTKLRKEIGDAFVYLDLLAQAHDFTIVDAALEVFHAKSIEIGYEVEAESRTERGAQEEPKNYDVYSAEVERDLSINYEAVRAPHPERTEPK